MRYRVHGVSRSTGAETILIIEARDHEAAGAIAQRHLIVAEVVPEGGLAEPEPPAYESLANDDLTALASVVQSRTQPAARVDILRKTMPADDSLEADRTPRAARNARLGLWFFFAYCALYGGFMGLTAFSFKTLGDPVAGVNWAIVYGMGLIAAAFVLAVIYLFACRETDEGGKASGLAEDRS